MATAALEGVSLTARVPAWAVPAERAGIAVRSEEVALADAGEGAGKNTDAFAVTLTSLREEGLVLRVLCQGSIALDLLPPRGAEPGTLSTGAAALPPVRPEHVHLFRAKPKSDH
jgi:hypothetical protein